MGQIKLTKNVRQNTYTATCDILFNGTCIGELETEYGYTPQGKLRVKDYWVQINEINTHFSVDGRWETKASRGGKFCAEYETYQSEYTTSKAAKTAALAFIEQQLDTLRSLMIGCE